MGLAHRTLTSSMLQRLVSTAVVSTLLMPVALSARAFELHGLSAVVRPRLREFVEGGDLNDITIDFEDAQIEADF